MDAQLIHQLATIDDAVRGHTKKYHNSRALFSVTDQQSGQRVAYDLVDSFLLAALTNSDLLLSGATGCGKSHLSRMVMNALYGADGFANLTVTPGLNESDFIDIDVGAVKEGRKTVKQAIQTTPILTKPGATIHEINRTPEILQNVFISYLERIFSLKGIEFPVGVPFKEGEDSAQDSHYQFRVISINEGADYAGTSGIDRAVRDRVVLEVPMDYIRPRKDDRRRMIRTRNDAGLSIDRVNGGKLDDVLAIVNGVEQIPLSVSAEEFLVYLSGLSNCVKSSTDSKRGVNFSSKDFCGGCKHAKDSVSDKGNICGSVYEPSDRSAINFKKIGRIVAALRAYKVIDQVARGEVEKDRKFVQKYLGKVQVTMDDLIGVAPFILMSKMIIDPRWVNQHFQGSKYNATVHIVETAREKFTRFVRSPVYGALIKAGGAITPDISAQLKQYALEQDAWAYNLGDLAGENYVQLRVPQDRKTPLDQLL